MSSTLTAEYFTEDRRASALGWLIAGGSLSWVIGAQVITYLSNSGGWRYGYYYFIIPLLVFGFIASYLFLPKPVREDKVTNAKFTDGMRMVLSSWSSISCLLCSVLRMASFQLILVYSASYLRQDYFLSREVTSVLVTFAALSYTFGSLLSGRVVRRFGVKNVAVGARARAIINN
jgi:predicted MFS family arabinose efflux permease